MTHTGLLSWMGRILAGSLASIGVAVAITGGVAATAAGPSSGPASSETIMFTLSAAGSTVAELMLVGADGTGLRQLELPKNYDCCAALSPSATRISVGVDTPDQRVTSAILDIAGGTTHEIPLDDLDPGSSRAMGVWITDELATFEVWDDAAPAHTGMFVGDPMDPPTIHRLTTNPDGGQEIPLAVSPDLSRIAFARTRPQAETGTLHVVGMDGQDEQLVGPPDVMLNLDSSWGSPASWSPDGSRITFVNNGCGCEVWVVGSDGKDPQRIFSSAGLIFGAHWSPDGRWIAFESQPAGSQGDQVMIIHPDGTGLQQVTTGADGNGSWDPVWSPDGSRLVFQHGSGSGGGDSVTLWTSNVDGSDLAPLTDNIGHYEWIEWGPSLGGR